MSEKDLQNSSDDNISIISDCTCLKLEDCLKRIKNLEDGQLEEKNKNALLEEKYKNLEEKYQLIEKRLNQSEFNKNNNKKLIMVNQNDENIIKLIKQLEEANKEIEKYKTENELNLDELNKFKDKLENSEKIINQLEEEKIKNEKIFKEEKEKLLNQLNKVNNELINYKKEKNQLNWDILSSTNEENNFDSKGKILFKIENFSEFIKEEIGSNRQSNSIYINGFKWKILIKIVEKGFLGYFLQCDSDNKKDSSWKCYGGTDLKILPQKQGKPKFYRSMSHIYSERSNIYGYARYLPIEKIMNIDDGWYNEKDDNIICFAEVEARDLPQEYCF